MTISPLKLSFCGVAALPALLTFAVASSQAQDTHTWNDPNGGVWGTFTKWTPVGIPSALDTTVFGLDADYTVSFIESRAVEELRVEDGNVTFRGSGIFAGDRAYTVDNATIGTATTSTLFLDSATSGHRMKLIVNDSIDVTRGLHVLGGSTVQSGVAHVNPINAGVTATAVVRGTDASGVASRWDTTNLEVGAGRDGTLIVDDGGIMAAEQVFIGVQGEGVGSGRVNIRGTAPDGSPSVFSASGGLRVGVGSSGGFTVTDGALAHTPGSTRIGTSATSGNGRVAGVDAAGNPARWTAGTLSVSRGSLRVVNGGVLTSTDSVVGTVTGHSAQVRVGDDDAADDSASWTIDGALTISDGASGSVQVLSGAQLSSAKALIGVGAAGAGELTLENGGAGAPSAWSNSGDVFVGGSEFAEGGSGILSLFENSQADVAGNVKIWGTGQVTLRNRTKLTADQVLNTDGGAFNFTGGTLQTNRYEGDLNNVSGTLAPGPDAGSTVITGDYTQGMYGTLALDIGGTTAGVTHDLVNLAGTALLDGRLAVSLIDGFTPDAFDAFTVLASGTLFDSFNNALNGQRVTTTAGDGSFVVNYGIGSAFTENRVVLSDFMALVVLAGDYNGSGQVEQGDLDLVLQNWGDDTDITGLPAAWTNDNANVGQIEQTELDGVLQNWGNTSAPNFDGFTNIPEPAGLLAMVTMGLISTRGRRRAV